MATKPNHSRIYRKVPAYLRELREQAGLTQRELAARTRMPQWWVHRAETGSRRVDVAEFILFCTGCGVDAAASLNTLMKR
jgi:transcriptional regulator with XRE-family HTH domain